ncbi:MAG: exodeoxyribonuclease III [Bacteroidales bacterium]|nr:exodeoxyribonuclease III [Bacteroidales bacterium]
MKFISWNVNGLRACCGKGFAEAFASLDADFFCLQETKMQPGQLDLAFEGYRSYWNSAEKKGYSGTAIFTRHEPLSVSYGLGLEPHDHEGRVITLEMPDFYLVTVYTPNSQDGLRRLDYRMEWDDAFRDYLQRLDAVKPVVVCGDLNVAHREIDLKNPKTNRKNAGFTDEERAKFGQLLEAGFTDTFRHFYPDAEGVYSWWSYRFKAREKNAGWRIDYFLVSDRLQPRLRQAAIHNEVYGSDHCPVEVVVDFDAPDV